MGAMYLLVSRPFAAANLVFLLGLRLACLAALSWSRLIRGIISLPLNLCWIVMVWTTALVLLPIRISTALQKERTLEMNLREMQIQLESLSWENKELEERLQIAIKDRKVVETIFEEIEEEYEEALSRIDLLENELQDLKEENLRLNEVQGKAPWDYKARDDAVGYVPEDIHHVKEILMHGDSFGKGDEGEPKERYMLKSFSSCAQEVARDLLLEKALKQRRAVALSGSFFSAILSLLVGIVIWQAEDPCMPLVAALFIVVGMSLISVVQFLSTIKIKPASDAVALLSINWFILGTITSPSLPTVAHMLAPRAVTCCLALSSYFARK